MYVNDVYSIHIIIIMCALVDPYICRSMNIINACLYTIPYIGEEDETRSHTYRQCHACL